MPSTQNFLDALDRKLARAAEAGLRAVEITGAELHGAVGGYPGPSHRMPACCGAMRKAMQAGDAIVSEPPSGKGASLKVRYALPR